MAAPKDRRPGFSRRAQYSLFFTSILAIAGAVVGAVLLVLSRFDPPAFAALRSTVAEATSPVSTALAVSADGIASVPVTVGTYFRVHGENAELRAQIARDRALVARARALAYENLRLRRIAQLRDGDASVVVTARIVSSSPESARRFGLLNAGLWQGVRRGQPVRGPNGLIGRVVEVGPNTARVLLLTDAESVIPVRRTRDGRAALASGRGDAMLEVRGVESGDPQFRPGDVFVTSGTGGLYAPGVPVAVIEQHTREGGLGRPVASPSALDLALVTHAFLPPPPPPAATQPPPPAPSPTPTPASSPTP